MKRGCVLPLNEDLIQIDLVFHEGRFYENGLDRMSASFVRNVNAGRMKNNFKSICPIEINVFIVNIVYISIKRN